MAPITLESDFGLVITAVTALSMQCFLIGGSIGGSRKKFFNDEFLKKNFGDEHKKAFGQSVPKHGYPDTGTGRYSDKLSYKEWFEFNTHQRVHLNFVESIGFILALLIVNGLQFPLLSGILGWVYFFGRLLYTLGYLSKKGPNGRETGALLMLLATLSLFALGFISGIKLMWSGEKQIIYTNTAEGTK